MCLGSSPGTLIPLHPWSKTESKCKKALEQSADVGAGRWGEQGGGERREGGGEHSTQGNTDKYTTGHTQTQTTQKEERILGG